MTTYANIMAQAKKLFAEAEEMRRKEAQAAIAEVRELIAMYDLTPSELGFSGSTLPVVQIRAKTPIKYLGPKGETWTGRGLIPNWLKAKVLDGKSIDQFRISEVGTQPKKKNQE